MLNVAGHVLPLFLQAFDGTGKTVNVLGLGSWVTLCSSAPVSCKGPCVACRAVRCYSAATLSHLITVPSNHVIDELFSLFSHL